MRKIKALWVGSPHVTWDGGRLYPNETVLEVGFHEAFASAFWRPVLEELTIDELRAAAELLGIPHSDLKKPQLIAAINDATGVVVASEAAAPSKAVADDTTNDASGGS